MFVRFDRTTIKKSKILTIDIKVDREIGGKTTSIYDVNFIRHRADVNWDQLL